VQTLVFPVMAPGVLGAVVTVTAAVWALLLPQLLFAVTATLPEVLPKFTVIALVPWPDATVAPVGTVHV
jgi:hypothetical protein